MALPGPTVGDNFSSVQIYWQDGRRDESGAHARAATRLRKMCQTSAILPHELALRAGRPLRETRHGQYVSFAADSRGRGLRSFPTCSPRPSVVPRLRRIARASPRRGRREWHTLPGAPALPRSVPVGRAPESPLSASRRILWPSGHIVSCA